MAGRQRGHLRRDGLTLHTLAVDDESKVSSVKVTFNGDAGNEEESTGATTAAVEADPLPPLTSSLENIAMSHDGENAFTFGCGSARNSA